MPARKILASLFSGCFVLLLALPALGSNDPYWSKQWGMSKVGADKAWSTGTGRGTTIAIVDTGVDLTHPDLARNIVDGHDFIDGDSYPRDLNGHGTHVAGIAAAIANNGVGVAGVAPDAKIMPVRVLGPDGTGSGADVDSGIRWAADHHADVINLSLSDGVVIEDVSGGSMSDACNYAWGKGAICVAAAGNEGFFRTEQNAAKVVIVTATGPDDTKASYATGVGLAPWGMAAPGGTSDNGQASEILSTYWSTKGSRYAYAMGTSMAAPHVTGALAVLRGLGLSPQQAVDRLLSTARDIGGSGNDLTYGHGLLNVAAAVAGLHPAHVASGGGVTPSTGRTSTDASPPRAPAASSGRTTTTTHPGTTPGSASPSATTHASDASASPGFAAFPSTHTHHGSNAWIGIFAALGAGLIGVSAFGYRAWRRGG